MSCNKRINRVDVPEFFSTSCRRRNASRCLCDKRCSSVQALLKRAHAQGKWVKASKNEEAKLLKLLRTAPVATSGADVATGVPDCGSGVVLRSAVKHASYDALYALAGVLVYLALPY